MTALATPSPYAVPLEQALSYLPGTRYLRYMDDWVILAKSRWKLRKAVRIINQVLSDLGLRQHPDKTFIGRTDSGFDFLGVQFTATGEPSPSAVSRARHTENTARLYEQGASPERIEQYRQNWLRYLRGILGRDHPATKTRKTRSATVTTRIPQPYSVLSSCEPSLHLRCTQVGAINKHTNNYEKTEQIRDLPRGNRGSRLCNKR